MTGNTITILLIDDDIKFLQLLHVELERRGYEVTTADSGNQGLEKFNEAELNEAEFDIVITEIALSDGNGADVIKSIRQGNSNAHIIGMSGDYKHSHDVIKRWGADEAIWKPFRMRKLQTLMDKLVT